MNNSLKTTFTLLVLSIGLGLPAMRADDAAAAATTTAPSTTTAPKAHGSHRADAMAELNLTPDQKSKVEAIRKDERSALSTLKADTAPADADKKAKRKEIMESHQAQIRALLTPDQQAKFDALPKPGAHAAKGKADSSKS